MVSSKKLTLWFRSVGCVVAICSAQAVIAQPSDPAFEQLKSYYFGRDATALDTITALVQRSRSLPAQRAAVAAGLASVLTSSAPFDAKQFACRQLVFVAGEPEIPALAGLLSDEKLCHYALMALAKIPGDAVNDSLVARISGTTGENRLELLGLLADRGDTRDINPLWAIIEHSNATDREYAFAALARHTNPASDLSVSLNRPRSNDALFHEVLTRGYLLAHIGAIDQAKQLFTEVNSFDSPIAHAAALRGLLRTSKDPTGLVLKALGEDGTPRQKMAAEIVNDVPGAAATRTFAAALPKLTARGQVLLLTALGSRGDEAASAGVMALSRSSNSEVRLAALKALGQVGNAAAVSVLLNTAAAGAGQERDMARLSLARLRDDRINKALAATVLSNSETAQRKIEAITAIGSRGATEAMPEIMDAAADKNSTLSGAAFAVLRDIAPASQLSVVVALALSLPPNSRDIAVEAAAEIARRGTSEARRTGPVISALRNATKPADKLTLLTVLDQVGGPAALQSLEKAVSDSIPDIRDGALAMISEWPTDEPMDLLRRTVHARGDPRLKSIALRGYLRMIGVNEQRLPDVTLALYQDVSADAQRAEDKRQILSGVANLHILAALQFSSEFMKDADVKAEAETALVTIGRSTIGAYPDETRTALEPIAGPGTDEAARKQASEVLALPARSGDFIIAWEVSPSYHQDGVDYTHLFDMPFPPETAAADKMTPWRLMPIVTNPEQPWLLDLLALWGGEQRVAYLRTAVGTDASRDLMLELGSDDGVKAWLNGKVILADNTQRGVAPGQEKVKVHLNAGWNTLLLKVTQNVLGWGACARFAGMDGSPVTGLRYSVVSALK